MRANSGVKVFTPGARGLTFLGLLPVVLVQTHSSYKSELLAQDGAKSSLPRAVWQPSAPMASNCTLYNYMTNKLISTNSFFFFAVTQRGNLAPAEGGLLQPNCVFLINCYFMDLLV